MSQAIKSFADDICHPCYLRKHICTRDVSPGSFLLIVGKETRIFLAVNESFTGEEYAIPFLKVDILGYRNCTIPAQSKGLFMCGADPNPKFDQGRVIFTPFVRIGYAIFISEMHLQSSKVSGFYYSVEQIFMLGDHLVQ
jgi:hypothetical protein